MHGEHNVKLCYCFFLIQELPHCTEQSSYSERGLSFGWQAIDSPALASSLYDSTHCQLDRSQNTTIDSGSARVPFHRLPVPKSEEDYTELRRKFIKALSKRLACHYNRFGNDVVPATNRVTLTITWLNTLRFRPILGIWHVAFMRGFVEQHIVTANIL